VGNAEDFRTVAQLEDEDDDAVSGGDGEQYV